MPRPPRSEPAPRAWVRLDGKGFTSDEVELGYVSGVFGVKGEVRLFLHHRGSDLFKKRRSIVMLSPSGVRYRAALKSRVGAGNRVLGRFEGLDDRNVAASLKDWRIGIPEADLPTLGEGEFYFRDLVGADVFSGEQRIGEVVEVHETPTSEIFEIDIGEEETIFVPSLEEFVQSVEPGMVVLTPQAVEE